MIVTIATMVYLKLGVGDKENSLSINSKMLYLVFESVVMKIQGCAKTTFSLLELDVLKDVGLRFFRVITKSSLQLLMKLTSLHIYGEQGHIPPICTTSKAVSKCLYSIWRNRVSNRIDKEKFKLREVAVKRS